MLVSVAVEGGIADNLSGLMSEFWLALLSDRALQVYEYGYLPRYEPAFEQVYHLTEESESGREGMDAS